MYLVFPLIQRPLQQNFAQDLPGDLVASRTPSSGFLGFQNFLLPMLVDNRNKVPSLCQQLSSQDS